MNRHQRRHMAKKGLKPIADAASKLQEALGAVQTFTDPKEVERLVQEAHQTVSLLVDDVQQLANEHERLRTEHELLKKLLFDQDPAMKLVFERTLSVTSADASSVSMGTAVPHRICPTCVETGPCLHR